MELDVLAFGAHRDDIELTCGGTMIKLENQGYKTGIIDLTAGEMGTRGSAGERAEEAEQAAKILRVQCRDNLRIPDANIEINTQSEAVETVKTVISSILDQGNVDIPFASTGPTVYLFVGVNGVGKTTSIAKIAAKLKQDGKKVLVAAGDTFRAAAIEQLNEWCIRVGVELVSKEINSDPSATMYEAASKAVEENYDVLLCDTSGRLHTKKNLMDELAKMQRVLKKVIPEAPHASVLVLDANTGQNAIMQTKEFSTIIGLHGLIITKLDGTAKGGVVIGIVNEFELPVYYIGVGEGLDDLQPFSAKVFAESLFE